MEISELAPLVLIDSKNVKRNLTDLFDDQIENQTTNKSMQEVSDPLMDQTKELKDHKPSKEIKMNSISLP